MWISSQFARFVNNDKAEKGVVTMSNNGNWEAGSTVSSRSISAYTPYGYSAFAPVGEEVILVPSSDGQVSVGVKCASNDLNSGEIKISSKGGANIVLKNDGTVVINSLVIDKEGNIKQ